MPLESARVESAAHRDRRRGRIGPGNLPAPALLAPEAVAWSGEWFGIFAMGGRSPGYRELPMQVDCPYCAKPLVDAETHGEHFIARALGWPVTVRAHLRCGEQLNAQIDEPLVKDFFVRKLRSDYAIPGRRGAIPEEPRLPARDDQGERMLVEFLSFARIDVRRTDTERSRIARGAKRLRVEPFRMRLVWPRMAAKAALGVGALIGAPSWIHSDTAGLLREVLWTTVAAPTTLVLPVAPESPPENLAIRGALLAPEHFVWTSHTSDGRASVCLALFDEDVFVPAPLALTLDEGRLLADHAWLIDPRRSRVRLEGPLNEVTTHLEQRRPQVMRVRAAFAEALRQAQAHRRAVAS